MSSTATLTGLRTTLEANSITVLVDEQKAPLPSVEILPPAIDRFHETHEGFHGVERELWVLRLYTEPTFAAAVELLDSVLDAISDDVSLDGTAVFSTFARVDVPRRDEPDRNNRTRYIREAVLAVEYN